MIVLLEPFHARLSTRGIWLAYAVAILCLVGAVRPYESVDKDRHFSRTLIFDWVVWSCTR